MGMVMVEVRVAGPLGSRARMQRDAMGTPSDNGLWNADPLWVWSQVVYLGYCGTVFL